MFRKLFPLILMAGSLAGGLGAGFALRPDEDQATALADPAAATSPPPDAAATDATAPLQHDYVKFNNQFVVPIVERERVAAVVVLSLSLEVTPGLTDRIYEMEPKLRDTLLQVLFNHANNGGFSGSFTDAATLVTLRTALLEAAKGILESDVTDVLIADIVRQDS